MAVLENSADGHGELAFAIGTPTQASPGLGHWIGRNGRKLCLVVALAMRADDAIFPEHAFQMGTGLVIRAEPIKELNQSQVFFSGRRFHVQNLP